MKISCALVLCCILVSVFKSQVRENPKLPSDVGFGCLDVTKKLNSEVKDGRMQVAQCCQGVKLIADVTEEIKPKQGTKLKITGWHVLGDNGRELEAEKGEVRRDNASGSKSNETSSFYETIIIVRHPAACFIIDRKDRRSD